MVFVNVSTHKSKHTSTSHLNKFYVSFEKIKDQRFDGFIITGAPVEQMPFEEVDIMGRTERDYGMDKDTCDFYNALVLGAQGTVLSLWN